MSFLGCIGYIMEDSGLEQVLEQIYTLGSVKHILSVKAISRAVHAHSIVDLALHLIIIMLTSRYGNFDENAVNCTCKDDLNQASNLYECAIANNANAGSFNEILSDALDRFLRYCNNFETKYNVVELQSYGCSTYSINFKTIY